MGGDFGRQVSEIETELAQWERFALNRLNREGKAEKRPFEVTVVPDELAFEVSAGLLVRRGSGGV